MSDSKKHTPSSFDDHLRDLVRGILIPGIVLSAMVLMAFAYTASQRRARPHLHRVSFRLLVYALISNFILSVTLIPMENLMTGPPSSAGCTFAAFASNGSLLFSACMYFCMALNLQLVLIHGVNGLIMEKYYVIGSFLLVGVCTISPLAAGQFKGLYNGLCDDLKFRWLVPTQSFWILLMAASELVCFVILMSYMLRHRMSVKRTRSDISAEMTALQYAAYSAAPILQFRGIILRIVLYPFLSCVLNFSGSTLDLYLAKHLENTELNSQLNVLDDCIFNARPFLYAVLAATDPSFIRAIGALRNLHPSTGSDGSQQSSSTPKSRAQSSCSTAPSLYTRTLANGNQAEGQSAESIVRQSLDATGRPQQTEADVHHTRTHRDPEEGSERHSNVEGRKDSIEFQI
ncbi:hypothetical protein B0H16DRAFT_1902493 [Mycena metata]|uniref:Uncharacterized protein n=1 Tax=Mycena metata TaxID=1033252 RepID=A0AAD7DXJ1_9AGAR|nr:hypothetical protein B0H16DRAFT_1902493 [Mycena metata]